MPPFKSTILTFIATCCLINSAAAQSSCSGGGGSYRKRHVAGQLHPQPYQHALGYGHGYQFGYVGRSTHYSAARLHGAADVIRARGAANLLNAQAATQAQETRTRDLENDVFELNTRVERRRINNETRFGHLHALAAQRKAQHAQMVQLGAGGPRRLTVGELDPATGQLQWPLLLQSQHFAKARRPVDGLFAVRAKHGSIHPDDYLPLRNWIERVKAELQMHVDTLPKDDYAVAQDFLRRLTVEVRLPIETGVDDAFLVSN